MSEKHPGELGKWRANRTQSGWRAVGGRLVLTGDRLEFRPHAFDGALGGKSCAIELDGIRAVGKEPRSITPANLFSGGLRERLRVERADGTVELFVVNRLDDAIGQIQTALGR